jgi:hypothetical protein
LKRSQQAGPKHFVIPDTQLRRDDDLSFIAWAGRYIRDKKPDVIVQLGDWFDFPSLSSYDEGTKKMEGQDISDDIKAGERGQTILEAEIRKAGRGYKPRKVALGGNHDGEAPGGRPYRYLQANPKHFNTYNGIVESSWLRHGWEYHHFLKPVGVHGIYYAHYFCIGANGRVSNSKHGQPSAKVQVQRLMRTSTAGHRQGLDVAIHHTPTATYRGLIAGSFYTHEEGYLTPQGVNHWRGCIVKHDIDVRTGFYNIVEVDMRFFERKYG